MVDISGVGKPYFRSFSRPPEFTNYKRGLEILNRSESKDQQDRSQTTFTPREEDVLGVEIQLQQQEVKTGPRIACDTGSTSIANSTIGKGPFDLCHGRRPVLSSNGRVRIWVREKTDSHAKKIEFSAYGGYLKEPGEKFLGFNERGISIVSGDGRELWHADMEVLRLRKSGSVDLLEQHQRELTAQRAT